MNEKNENTLDVLARRNYEPIRRHAFWRKIRSWLGRKCDDLLPAERVLKNLLMQESRNLGLQQVPIERIVGSGRYRDFSLAFLPLRQESNGRWQSIARARRQGISLPPPLLYQVGDAYIVEDGNHRISVARSAGQEYIEANVVAIDTSTLKVEPSCTRLGYKIAASQPQNGTASCSV
jgi:hypothetical protein